MNGDQLPLRHEPDEKLTAGERILREHVTTLREPEGLSSVTERRIASRLRQLVEQKQNQQRIPWSRIVYVTIGTAILASILGWQIYAPSTRKPELAANQPILVDGAQVTAEAGAQITWPSGSGLLLSDGSVLVETQDGALRVSVGKTEVQVAPHSRVHISLRLSHIEIASYEGKAEVIGSDYSKTIEVTAHQTWSSSYAGQTKNEPTEPQGTAGTSTEKSATVSIVKTSASGKADVRAKPESRQPISHEEKIEHETVTTNEETAAKISTARTVDGEISKMQAALQALAHRHPEEALRLVDEWQSQAASHELEEEALRIRVDAYVALQQKDRARELLEKATALPAKLRLLRAELSEEAQEFDRALVDYASVLEHGRRSLHERALYGKIVVLGRLYRWGEAKFEIDRYEGLYPNGQYLTSLHELSNQQNVVP